VRLCEGEEEEEEEEVVVVIRMDRWRAVAFNLRV